MYPIKPDDAVARFGHIVVVRDDHDRLSCIAHSLQQSQNERPVFRVQGAGRLVGGVE
ncbi:hypothetical protein [Dubosiella muris]|uniref:hypothetical protein n=1 Tax=Dubosiella muris TaxID=3038133 RepID=UPI00240F2813|nr:hypothetical protein [Dubosiella muris]